MKKVVLIPATKETLVNQESLTHIKHRLLGKRITPTIEIIIRHKERSDSYYRIESLYPNQETLIVSADTIIEFSNRKIASNTQFSLKVAEAYPKDEGRGYVRMELTQMLKHNINRNDKVFLTAPHKSEWGIGATVLPSTHVDIGLNLIRMDSGIRGNLQLSVGQYVCIQRLQQLEKAVQITIVPANERTKLLVKSDLLKNRLLNHLLIQDQVLIMKGKVRILPPKGYPKLVELIKTRNVTLVIDSTIPKGVVQVDESTEVVVKELFKKC